MGVTDSEGDLVEVEDGDESKETTTPTSPIFSLLKRLLFPTLILIFVLLYIRNTWGEISFRNLWYPYFLITCTLALLSSIYVTEILGVYRERDEGTVTLVEDIRTTYQDWDLSIGVVVLAGIYLYITDYIGFFFASFVTMSAIMRIGGVKSWKTIILLSIIVLVFVYVMFIMVLGIRPPSGPIEIV